MLDRITLTARYLEEVERCGATGSDLVSYIASTGWRAGLQFLSRPLFIGHAEAAGRGVHAPRDDPRGRLAALGGEQLGHRPDPALDHERAAPSRWRAPRATAAGWCRRPSPAAHPGRRTAG